MGPLRVWNTFLWIASSLNTSGGTWKSSREGVCSYTGQGLVRCIEFRMHSAAIRRSETSSTSLALEIGTNYEKLSEE